MRWRLMLTLVVAVVAAGCFILSLPHWHSRSLPTDPGPWPSHLPIGVALPKAETFRNVDFYPGTNTPKHSIAEHADGQLSHYWFRSSGKLREAKTFSRVVSGKRALLRHALFDVDGVNYLSDMEFYADGVMKKLVLKISDTVTFRWQYFDTGELRLFENYETTDKPGLWLKRIADSYRKDGSLEEHFKQIDKRTWEYRSFSPENKLTKVRIKSSWGYQYTELNYFPDGETVSRKVEQYSNRTELWLYHPNSQVQEHRKWIGTVETGTIYLYRYDLKGVQTLEQTWTFDEKSKTYLPMWSIVYKNGKSKYRFWHLMNTSKLHTVQHYLTDKEWNGRQIQYELYDDGTVKSMSELTKNNGDVLSSVKYSLEQKQPLPIKLNPAWFNFVQVELPPQEVEYDPSDR